MNNQQINEIFTLNDQIEEVQNFLQNLIQFSASSFSILQSFPKSKIRLSEDFHSIIDCGILNPNGQRVYSHYPTFFEKEIEIYSAVIDQENRILYRANSLAEKFKCLRSTIGMYLKRNIHTSDGIFQATLFRFKPRGCVGLKEGGYFITLEVCKTFEKYFNEKAKRKIEREIDRILSKRIKFDSLNSNITTENIENSEIQTKFISDEPGSATVSNFFSLNEINFLSSFEFENSSVSLSSTESLQFYPNPNFSALIEEIS